MRGLTKRTCQSVEEVLTTKPGPRVIRVLLENSLADDFESARQEWEYVGVIESMSYEFVENCELCGRKNYLKNYVILNPNTNRTLRVGSECIKRFIILNGTGSQEDSNRFFAIKQKEHEKLLQLRAMFSAVVEDIIPLYRNLNRFRKILLELLVSKGDLPTIEATHTIEDPQAFTKVVAHDIFGLVNPPVKVLNRLHDILFKPTEITVQKETKRFRDIQIKEGTTWIKKKTRVYTSLSRSSAFRNPSDKYKYN